MQSVKCSFCGFICQQRSLIRHIRTYHPAHATPLKARSLSPLICSVCKNPYKNREEFIRHLSESHDVSGITVTMDFDSLEEFHAWKTKMERETCSQYYKGSCGQVKKGQVLRFDCSRSGFYRSKGGGTRRLKSQGSKKINGFCPSSIKVRVSKDGKCSATFFKNHWGHTGDLRHLTLSEEERKAIAGKIAANIPLEEILSEIRRSSSNPNELKRLDLIKRSDLYNIKASFKLTSNNHYMKHNSDALNIDAWVSEMRTRADGSILFFKPQNQSCNEFPSLPYEDFFLAIMTNAQSKMLVSHGHDIVCMDRTNDRNGYGFQLATLLVVDDLKEAFPCAFLFTSRLAAEHLKVFFAKIKERLGKRLPTPKIFMSGMEDTFYNAWAETVGALPGNWLYCAWLVDKDWKIHLEDIEKTEKKCEVYKMLRWLMEVEDEKSFSEVLALAVKNLLGDPATKVFGEYFKARYARNPQRWAFCHRLPLRIGSNMYMESMHNCLKHFERVGKTNKRLDQGIFAVMRFLSHKMSRQTSSKIRVAQSQHKADLNMGRVIVMKIPTTDQLGGAHSDDGCDADDLYRLTIASSDDESRIMGKENSQAEVCGGKLEPSSSALMKEKEETVALLKNLSTLVETSKSIEEVAAVKNCLASAALAMAAARQSPGERVLQNNSNKRKTEPATRFEGSSKKARTRTLQNIS